MKSTLSPLLTLLLLSSSAGQHLPRGGGSCSTDFDCSLGGLCKHQTCVCDAAYTGSQCGVLRLRRAKLNNGMANSTAAHTWGGHALKDDETGKVGGAQGGFGFDISPMV